MLQVVGDTAGGLLQPIVPAQPLNPQLFVLHKLMSKKTPPAPTESNLYLFGTKACVGHAFSHLHLDLKRCKETILVTLLLCALVLLVFIFPDVGFVVAVFTCKQCFNCQLDSKRKKTNNVSMWSLWYAGTVLFFHELYHS